MATLKQTPVSVYGRSAKLTALLSSCRGWGPRGCPAQAQPVGTRLARQQAGRRRRRRGVIGGDDGGRVHEGPVSYTHLTLPTICSV
eukprot:2844858-Prymnesium_polylepis.1